LIEPQFLTWPQAIRKMTINPAQALGLSKGTLQVGADADVTIIDPDVRWTVRRDEFHSRSRNTPFEGAELVGRAVRVIVDGEVRFARD